MGAYIVYYILVAIIAASYVGGWVKEFLGGNRPAGLDHNGVEKVPSQ